MKLKYTQIKNTSYSGKLSPWEVLLNISKLKSIFLQKNTVVIKFLVFFFLIKSNKV